MPQEQRGCAALCWQHLGVDALSQAHDWMSTLPWCCAWQGAHRRGWSEADIAAPLQHWHSAPYATLDGWGPGIHAFWGYQWHTHPSQIHHAMLRIQVCPKCGFGCSPVADALLISNE